MFLNFIVHQLLGNTMQYSIQGHRFSGLWRGQEAWDLRLSPDHGDCQAQGLKLLRQKQRIKNSFPSDGHVAGSWHCDLMDTFLCSIESVLPFEGARMWAYYFFSFPSHMLFKCHLTVLSVKSANVSPIWMLPGLTHLKTAAGVLATQPVAPTQLRSVQKACWLQEACTVMQICQSVFN